MDIVSLLLLQPDDQIREQCKLLDSRTLYRFVQTNSRVRDICGDILAVMKKEYEKEKSELLGLFTVHNDKTFTFQKEINSIDQFTIDNGMLSDDYIGIYITPSNQIFSDFISKITHRSIGSHIFINKNLFSDRLKLDILSIAKKLGYTKVYFYDHITGERTPYKSLNEFSII